MQRHIIHIAYIEGCIKLVEYHMLHHRVKLLIKAGSPINAGSQIITGSPTIDGPKLTLGTSHNTPV